MHTMLDSIIANAAVWIVLCVVLLAPIQTENVSQELKKSQYMLQASSVLRAAESLGYISELVRCEGDLPSVEMTMRKIAQLCPSGSSCTLRWSTEKGRVINTLGTEDLSVAGYITIIVSTSTQITYLTVGVGER